MTNVSAKTNTNTKTAGYKEGIAFVANLLRGLEFDASNPPAASAIPSVPLEMVADLFARPIEKVLVDVAKALVR